MAPADDSGIRLRSIGGLQTGGVRGIVYGDDRNEPGVRREERAMVRLSLPSMVAGRSLANTLVERLAVTRPLQHEVVIVDCRRLVSASPSFAAQLVKAVLLDRQASALRVVDAPQDLAEYVADAAARLGVADRVTVELASAHV